MAWVGRWWCETPEQSRCSHEWDWDYTDSGTAFECVVCGAISQDTFNITNESDESSI
jgi:hypothetical protein